MDRPPVTARTCFIFSGRVGRWVIGWLVGRLVWFGLVSWDRGSLCSPDWSGIHCIVQVNLRLIDVSFLKPPECWDSKCEPPYWAFSSIYRPPRWKLFSSTSPSKPATILVWENPDLPYSPLVGKLSSTLNYLKKISVLLVAPCSTPVCPLAVWGPNDTSS